MPYAVSGDFDGNGLTDIAAVLLSDSEWKLVVFEQNAASNYRPMIVTGGPIGSSGKAMEDPHRLSLALDKGGEEWTTTSLGKTFKYKFPVDAIELTEIDGPLWLIHRSGDEYKYEVFGYE